MYGDWQGLLNKNFEPLTVDIKALVAASQSVYPKHYAVNGIVPAGGQTNPAPKAHINNNVVFWCVGFTGRFTTLSGGADVGVCQVDIKIKDTGKDVDIIRDFIPLDILIAPGRVRSPGVAGDPSHQVFYPGFINHIFLPESDIQVEMSSSATDDENTVNLDFFGYNFVVPSSSFLNMDDRALLNRF